MKKKKEKIKAEQRAKAAEKAIKNVKSNKVMSTVGPPYCRMQQLRNTGRDDEAGSISFLG